MKKILAIIISTSLFVGGVFADPGHVRLAWDPNSEPDIAFYRVHYGLISNTDPAFTSYPNVVDVPANVGVDAQGLAAILHKEKVVAGGVYYCAVTAVNTSDLESDYSNEISFTMPDKPGNNRINK